MCANDQDSGVEDEDLSPRPSPSPHLPAQQVSFRMDSGPVFLVDNFRTQPNGGAVSEDVDRAVLVLPGPSARLASVTSSALVSGSQSPAVRP